MADPDLIRSRTVGRVAAALCVGFGTVAVLLGLVYAPPILSRLFLLPDGFSRQASGGLWTVTLVSVATGIVLIRFRRSRWAWNLAATCFGLGVVLLACEAVLRAYIDEPSYRRADAELHHTFLPDAYGSEVWGRRIVNYRTNNLAFRDSTRRNVEPSVAAFRIVLVGDSFVEGIGVDYRNTVAGTLGEELKASSSIDPSTDFEILNAGVSGYSPKLELRRLEKFFNAGYTTDLVLLFVDTSDLRNEGIDYAEWERYSDAEVAAIRRSGWAKHFLIPRLLQFVRSRLSALASENEANAGLAVIPPRHRAAALRDSTLYSEGFHGWKKEGLESVEMYVRKIADLVAEHDAGFALVIYPHPQQVTPAEVNHMGSYRFEMNAMADEMGYPLLDLFPVFNADSAVAGRFIPGDIHWSESGHALVSESVVRFLAAEHLVPVSAGVLLPSIGNATAGNLD
ncbi:MAG: GDSL-type esterase/lipase family protein [Rhodothermales bacterium]